MAVNLFRQAPPPEEPPLAKFRAGGSPRAAISSFIPLLFCALAVLIVSTQLPVLELK